MDRVIQQARRFEVSAEGFFDYQSPDAEGFVEHAGVA